jgi:hypothetical protein
MIMITQDLNDYYPMQSSGLLLTMVIWLISLMESLEVFHIQFELKFISGIFSILLLNSLNQLGNKQRGYFIFAMNYVDKLGLLTLNITDKDGNP